MDRNRRRVGIALSVISWSAFLAVWVGSTIMAQPPGLDQFLDRDLWKQRPAEAELKQLRHLVGDIPLGFGLEPWHVWRVSHIGHARYVVLLGQNLFFIPGGTSAKVELFDPASTMMRSWSFQTGWRNELTDASLTHSTELNTDLLVLRSAPVINGRDIAVEYFAINQDDLRLVRLEDSKGAAVQNEYLFPNSEIGIVPSAQSLQDWIGLLQSEEKSDVLSALVFLGGQHLDEQARMMLPETHESKYANLFQQLLADAGIRESIMRLTQSDNAWVRDAAILASRGPRERPIR
jgi:hypothetical protein